MHKLPLMAFLLLTILATGSSPAEGEGTVSPDLAKIAEAKTWKLVNVTATTSEKDGKRLVRLQAKDDGGSGSNAGLALLEGVKFTEGTIDVDLKGQNKKQRSFLGLAFHAADGKTFEAIYFRPFNFKADKEFRTRAVQYVSWPTHTWEKLRKEKPGVYEAAVKPVPDPDGWFHARIEVSKKKVRVFVNDDKEPCLVVDRLTEGGAGQVGLFIDVFDGTFANLKVTPAK